MKVANGGSPVPATSLRATVERKLAPHSEAERHHFDGSSAVGDAQIICTATGFELKGFMCTDGCVATCAINFPHGEHREWAIATWKSLRPVPSAEKPKSWWRIW